MNSPTPWWGTLVAAAVGLVGVLIAQWISARRDRLERRDRNRLEQLEVYQRLNQVIVDLTDALRLGNWDRARSLAPEFGHAVIPVSLYGRPSLGPSIDKFNRQLGELLQRTDLDETDKLQAADATMRRAGVLVTIMRSDVRRGPRWYVRAAAWVVAPKRRVRAVHLRWKQDWAVVQADLEQPIWPIIKDTSGQ